MTARKRLWRVTAYYARDNWPRRGQRHEWTATKHYQTEAAARHRVAVLVGAVEPAGGPWAGQRPERVTIERSAPVDGWELVAS